MESKIEVILIYSKNCIHCKNYKLVFLKAGLQLKDKANFLLCEESSCDSTMDKYEIESFPTTLIIWNDKLYGRSNEAIKYESLVDLFNRSYNKIRIDYLIAK